MIIADKEILMKDLYRNNSIEAFTKRLGSAEPTPGGGAAAALSSALGASLVMMAANLTAGKPEYAGSEEFIEDTLAEAETLRDRLLDGMDRDAEAFGKLMSAYSMPKGSGRTEAVFASSVEATEAPVAVMEDSLAALRLASAMMGRSNRNLESDLISAMQLLRAGIMAENNNVLANLPVIEKKDAALASELRRRADLIIYEAGTLVPDDH